MSDAPGSARTAPGFLRAAAGDLPAGAVVGEYRIEGVVGRGGMGVVYAAVQPVIEKKVAIKVLNAQLSADRDLVRRFVDEARAVNRIGHENIIDIFSFGQLADGRQYFVMEYLEGATLGARLESGDLAPADLPSILAQICEALDAAHAKKIVHRDLKPENVWIGVSNRGQPKVRLLDFGIAKLLETGERSITDVGAVIGTPHYMSPEQCNGRGVDHRTDIYALGVLMYRLFTGRLPIRGETYAEILAKQLLETPPPPATIAPEIPAALDRLIVRCLQKEPTARPQSAADLGAALVDIFGGAAGLSGPNPSSAPHAVRAGASSSELGSAATSLPSADPAASPSQSQRATGAAPAGAGRKLSAGARLAMMGAALALLGAGGWLVFRSGRSSDGASPPSAVAPRAPSPPPPEAAPAPGVAPSGAAPKLPEATTPTAAIEKPRSGAERRAPGSRTSAARPDAPAGTARAPAPGPKKLHERASSTGLVTDNPFE